MAVKTNQKDLKIDIDHLPPGFADPPLRWPKFNRRELEQIGLSYYAPYDLLSIFLTGQPVSAINVPLDPPDSDIGYAEARVGIPTGEVVGIEIVGYRSIASRLHPGWANILDRTGIARLEVLKDVIATIEAMPVSDSERHSSR